MPIRCRPFYAGLAVVVSLLAAGGLAAYFSVRANIRDEQDAAARGDFRVLFAPVALWPAVFTSELSRYVHALA